MHPKKAVVLRSGPPVLNAISLDHQPVMPFSWLFSGGWRPDRPRGCHRDRKGLGGLGYSINSSRNLVFSWCTKHPSCNKDPYFFSITAKFKPKLSSHDRWKKFLEPFWPYAAMLSVTTCAFLTSASSGLAWLWGILNETRISSAFFTLVNSVLIYHWIWNNISATKSGSFHWEVITTWLRVLLNLQPASLIFEKSMIPSMICGNFSCFTWLDIYTIT